ncbi:hypothetical protein DFH08DRAFT_721961 [Mycena albidolilacea]|uniref:Cytokinin riboside 5'-monophosphate phosphoribohydrolase n=1 Tax=Mycena albidolilacea TaxID=1033008 RepID=A0AAD7E940_9AGAR|nr:hypothetical protein DFH08DRAFT_721961 [Mycena albidolilacea]
MAIAQTPSKAVAVFCASCLGKQPAYRTAAVSLGAAIAQAEQTLVYGGGTKGLMGVVASEVLSEGGSVVGIVPFAISTAGGEGKGSAPGVENILKLGSDRIVVNSMSDRKNEMAKRVSGFFGLPGGFGTLDEILEVITWTQIGFHTKPIILLNVLSYFDPLRQLIRTGIEEGFIPADNENFVIFVEGPDAHAEHERFDWGTAGLSALASWDSAAAKPLFEWKEMKAEN